MNLNSNEPCWASFETGRKACSVKIVPFNIGTQTRHNLPTAGEERSRLSLENRKRMEKRAARLSRKSKRNAAVIFYGGIPFWLLKNRALPVLL
jgi:hypothetical protein